MVTLDCSGEREREEKKERERKIIKLCAHRPMREGGKGEEEKYDGKKEEERL